ncbi:nitrilase-related carbon-nitrogen hydrolase [Fulvivirga ligni]|uniref:nitrilase-related carbon-nitrogen hydrolase n=1 Tax=Fulvivirga ligni TaxID=2904246 RepID=UPI001F2D8C53|nr:nitrilase-related carbon-nitrogen hydrolase [Fulvivirga ligni]UII23720.1 hypothetical protein LVD16_10835 [Fulvivirga ligni]
MKALKKLTFVLALLILLIFSNGQYAIFFAIWLAVPMLLFATRRLKRWQGFLFAFLALGVSYFIGFDVVPFLPLVVSIIIAAIFSLFASLPYLIDSFFSKNRGSFINTLIFPCAAVLMEYAYHLINQYGTWGHFAYTQQFQQLLLQSISVFGMGYITFLIFWFAAVVNWVYEQHHHKRNIKKGVLAYSLVLGLTLIFGGYKMTFQNTSAQTVRVASLSASDDYALNFYLEGLNDEEKGHENKIEAQRQITRVNQHLLDRSVAQAKAGAKIVFWAEGNSAILKEDEEELYRRASKIAGDQHIYLGMGVAVLDHTKAKYLENKFILFDTAGNKVIDYWKGISVPGGEAEVSNNKATGIQKIVTPYGTIAGAICFDLDFPEYLRQAGGADILLAPSNDWKEIDPLHTDMARFRAIEQGFNLVRQTSHGLSVGTDHTGRVIEEMDHFEDNDKTLITHLPTKGVSTIYAAIGDSFIAFCLLMFAVTSIVLKKRSTFSGPASAV